MFFSDKFYKSSATLYSIEFLSFITTYFIDAQEKFKKEFVYTGKVNCRQKSTYSRMLNINLY